MRASVPRAPGTRSPRARAARSPRSRSGSRHKESCMSMNEERAMAADITNCDREPIHIPGAIQPHGVLLSLAEPDLVVAQASDNTASLLGRTVAHVLGQPLAALLEPGSFERVRRAAGREAPAE